MGLISLTDPVNDTLADATLIANNNAVLEALLNGNLDSANLGPGSVGVSELAANAVGAGAIADGSITSSKIADGSIASGDLADGAVTLAKLAAASVDATKLASALFLQIAHVRGHVGSTGTIVTGTSFTVTHDGTGVYTITLTSAYSTNVHAVVSPVTSSACFATITAGSPLTQVFHVQIFNSTGAAFDAPFMFRAEPSG